MNVPITVVRVLREEHGVMSVEEPARVISFRVRTGLASRPVRINVLQVERR